MSLAVPLPHVACDPSTNTTNTTPLYADTIRAVMRFIAAMDDVPTTLASPEEWSRLRVLAVRVRQNVTLSLISAGPQEEACITYSDGTPTTTTPSEIPSLLLTPHIVLRSLLHTVDTIKAGIDKKISSAQMMVAEDVAKEDEAVVPIVDEWADTGHLSNSSSSHPHGDDIPEGEGGDELAASCCNHQHPSSQEGHCNALPPHGRPPSSASNPSTSKPQPTPATATGYTIPESLSGCLFLPDQLSDSISSLCGVEHAFAALHQALVLPSRLPHLFGGPRQPWKCILLHGPPGTGKTSLAAGAAKAANAAFISVTASDLLSKWVGDSEKQVKAIFDFSARKTFHSSASSTTTITSTTPTPLPSRTVIFLDEIDALCGARGASGETEAARRVKTEFLLRMQRVDPHETTIIAATNMPWELDAAFRRRFDRQVYVGLPDTEARYRQLARTLWDHAPPVPFNTQATTPAHPSSLPTTTTTSITTPAPRTKGKKARRESQGATPLPTLAPTPTTTTTSTTPADMTSFKQRIPHRLTQLDCWEAALMLEGYSGSDMNAVVQYASMVPVETLEASPSFYPITYDLLHGQLIPPSKYGYYTPPTTNGDDGSYLYYPNCTLMEAGIPLPSSGCGGGEASVLHVPLAEIPGAQVGIPPVLLSHIRAAIRNFPASTRPEEVAKFIEYTAR